MILANHTLERYWRRIFISALAAVLVFFVVSLAFGAVPISLRQFFEFLCFNADPQTQLIIQSLRLPRALLALLIGALLASCGAVTQGLFRNPLADPSLIGISAGASMGASMVIVLMNSVQWSFGGLSLVALGAFSGGLFTVILVYQFASHSTKPLGTSVSTLLLVGIAITFLSGSFSRLLEFIADNEMLRRISLWQMGGLENADYSQVLIVSVVALLFFLQLPRYASALNALLLGESEARHLGVEVTKVKRHLIILVAAAMGTSVALVGIITFVGLIVPHMLRILVGPNHRYLIPLCAVFGGFLMVLSDMLARTIIAPTEMPVGLITTFIGAPLFIYLLRRQGTGGLP